MLTLHAKVDRLNRTINALVDTALVFNLITVQLASELGKSI